VTSVKDLEGHAATVLPKQAYDYYRSGADDMISLADNVNAFKKYRLRPRVMVDVSNIDMSTTLQGGSINISMPICAAPTAMHRMAHHAGEIATAKAAGSAGTLMCLSSLTTTPMEDVASATNSPKWYQLYVFKDRALTESLIRRAERSGYLAIVVTVDAPFLGKREADKKNSFTLPNHLRLANFMPQTQQGEQLNTTVCPLLSSSCLTLFCFSFRERLGFKNISRIRLILLWSGKIFFGSQRSPSCLSLSREW
jgi:(S)-2-hydroxy-acid oxidase